MSDKPSSSISTPDLIRACCEALDDKKASNVKILHMGSKSSIADYFVLASGTSDPHLRAMSGTLEKTLKEDCKASFAQDASDGSGWVVVDAFDVIFHLFTEPMRDFYSLDTLWKDAELVSIADLGEKKAAS
jgi:ribosome-associated protein